MPATGSRFAKPVKKCFKSTEQWVYCGIDFSSLEDYISALTTKDPEKLKVYTGVKQYEVIINGVSHLISEDTMVEYDGNLITGEELYEKLSNSKL